MPCLNSILDQSLDRRWGVAAGCSANGSSMSAESRYFDARALDVEMGS